VICKTCKHLATKSTEGNSKFLLFGCKLLKLKFGLEIDFRAGHWLGSKADKQEFNISDVPVKCKSYEVING